MDRRGVRRAVAPWLGVLLAVRVALAAAGASEAAGVPLGPGVLVDASSGVLYAMAPDGRLEGVEVQSGRVVWRTDRAARPLASRGGRLLAQTETGGPGSDLAVVLLDAVEPGVDGIEVRVPLPGKVDPAIDDGPGRRFLASGRLDGDDAWVTWSFCTTPTSGFDPGGAGGEECAEGAYRFDPASGEGGAVDPAAARLPPDPPLPEPLARRVEEGRLGGRLWRAGDRIVTTREERQVWLQRFDAESGEALPEVLLFGGGERVVRYPSADRRHLLASGPGPSGLPGTWRWALYDLASGEPLGEIVQPAVGARFVVHGTVLVQVAPRQRRRSGEAWLEEPLRLRAVDLETGDVVWTRPLRDPTWWGPMAPADPLPGGEP
jgi:hypothetical protein